MAKQLASFTLLVLVKMKGLKEMSGVRTWASFLQEYLVCSTTCVPVRIPKRSHGVLTWISHFLMPAQAMVFLL
jgi:hypothetical protein